MFTHIGEALVVALTLASGSVALAHDAAWHGGSLQTGATAVSELFARTQHGLDVHRTPWPAPVGHRQPRAEDISVEQPKKRDADAELERLDRAPSGKLMICRGC